MSGNVLPFPSRGPFAVRIEREEAAWLVLVRGHGWLHGTKREAEHDAEIIAQGFAVALKDQTNGD